MLRGLVRRLRDLERGLANRVRRNRKGLLAKMAAAQFFALTPDAVRRGLAVGLFWALMPMPFQMAPATLFCWLARGNLPLALLCVWISNPLTYAPILLLEFKVGQLLLDPDDDHSFHAPEGLAEMVSLGGVTLLVGALACGLAGFVIGYLVGGPLSNFMENLRHRRITMLKKRRLSMRRANQTSRGR